MKRAFWILFFLLLAVRLLSLTEPAGADQGLYSYAGQRILLGELPYRDAWDQKPPAIHYTYAVMQWVWPNQAVVAATDLVVAACVALCLIPLGTRIAGRTGAGHLAALLFLLLGNPAFTRLGGLRTRSQCETFIALAVTGALVLLIRERSSRPRLRALLAGLLLGIAFLFKYNAASYLGVAAAAVLIWTPGARDRIRQGLSVLAGFAVPVATTAAAFGAAGAFDDLIQATIFYNVRYSATTYTGALDFVRYLLSFPLEHARIDGLWFLGGLGCATLLVAGIWKPRVLIPVLWTAAACLTIVVNGSRGLPQYFVQAGPALALAAGVMGALVWPTLGPLLRVAGVALLAFAVWRVSDFTKPPSYIVHDLGYLRGQMSRTSFLERFGAYGSGGKFSALALEQLARRLKGSTAPQDTIYIFGFSPGAYALAERPSASRFFWSRPVVYEFNAGRPRYGPDGLLADLRRSSPKFVVLEHHDEGMETIDSATYFLGKPALREWLTAGYDPAGELEDYEVWQRRSSPTAQGLR